MQCVNGGRAESVRTERSIPGGCGLLAYTLLTVSVKTRANFKPALRLPVGEDVGQYERVDTFDREVGRRISLD